MTGYSTSYSDTSPYTTTASKTYGPTAASSTALAAFTIRGKDLLSNTPVTTTIYVYSRITNGKIMFSTKSTLTDA
jgi:hypothetical protein